MLRNSLHAALIMLGWSCSCLSTVCQFSCERKSAAQGRYHVRRVAGPSSRQVLAGKLCYIIYMLGTTVKLSMLFKFWDYSSAKKVPRYSVSCFALTLQSKAYTKRSNLRIELCLWIYPSILCSNARAGSECLFSPMSTAEGCPLSGVPLYDHIYKCCWIS